MGPDYHRPPLAEPLPASFVEREGWSAASPADSAPKGAWWTGFHDPLMDALMPRVRFDNQNVRQQYAQYIAAVALVHAANATLFPTLGLSVAASRSGSLERTGAQAGSLRQYQLGAPVNWSPDLWGKIRRQVEQNAANAQANEANLANIILAQQVTLASAIINLRVADANADLLSRAVAADRGNLKLISSAVATGFKLYPPSDAMQARSALEGAEANLINAGIARAQYAHAIAVLVGRNPEDFSIAHDPRLPDLPDIPQALPATLLERRPDIAAAERQVAAASAGIGMAVADYFPDITLTGSVSTAGSALADLFKAASSSWAVAGNAAETLLDFGARHAAVEQAKANYQASVANYRATVLGALQGIEDHLALSRLLGSESQVLDRAADDAAHATYIVNAEYQAGTVDYTTLAAATTNEVSTRQSALSAAQNRLQAAVSLIGDLGGGWTTADLRNPQHVSARSAVPSTR